MYENIEEIWLEVVHQVEKSTGLNCDNFKKAIFHVNNNIRSTENVPVQNPSFMSIPGMLSKPWWSITDFDDKLQMYLLRLEESYNEYLEEFEENYKTITFGDGTATAYYGPNEGWKSFLFYDEEANVVPGASKYFPKIASLLEEMRRENYIAKSHFSVLKAGASIAVHCGGINHELRMHYGLKIPDGDIAIKVGGEVRKWKNGNVLVFDDTFPHEVWNNTGHDRFILHCRLQHPDLCKHERELSYILDQELTKALEIRKNQQ